MGGAQRPARTLSFWARPKTTESQKHRFLAQADVGHNKRTIGHAYGPLNETLWRLTCGGREIAIYKVNQIVHLLGHHFISHKDNDRHRSQTQCAFRHRHALTEAQMELTDLYIQR